MKLKPHQRVSYDTAAERVLRCLAKEKSPVIASYVGMAIWPQNNLHAQGLGFAAARILAKMSAEGLVKWQVYRYSNPGEQWGM